MQLCKVCVIMFCEQACSALQMIKYIQRQLDKDGKVAEDLKILFLGELNPVAPKAQKKVPVPDGYVLFINYICV